MSQGAMPQPGRWPGAGGPEGPNLEAEPASLGRGKGVEKEGSPVGPAAPGEPGSCPLRSYSGEQEEDMYRAEDEIEKEKELLVRERGLSEPKLSVAPEMDIMDYCKKEWRGNTQMAKRMKKV
ncbi:ubiquitin thioesterase otulin-like [Sarcophilus harrisii]